jgi:hypothetical protein
MTANSARSAMIHGETSMSISARRALRSGAQPSLRRAQRIVIARVQLLPRWSIIGVGIARSGAASAAQRSLASAGDSRSAAMAPKGEAVAPKGVR